VKELFLMAEGYPNNAAKSSNYMRLKRKTGFLFFFLTAKIKSDRIPPNALCRARRVAAQAIAW
jgi:hypothetical protein